MKPAMILAAVAACGASGASAASISARSSSSCQDIVFQSLGQPGTGKCIIYNSYDSHSDTYGLTLGSCGSNVQGYLPLTFDKDTKTLHTMDNKYCVGTLGNKSNTGAQVGLVRCNDVHKNAQWKSLSDTEQWKNGYSLCLDYNTNLKILVQNACQTKPPTGSMQEYTFTGTKSYDPCPPPPPPPPSNTQSCGSWSTKNGGPNNSCGSGYCYTAGDSTKCNADGSDCKSKCCAKNPPPPPTKPQQTCSAWAVTLGGSPNCCGKNKAYNPDATTCNADGSNCNTQCCESVVY